VLERLVGHYRPEIGAADPDVHDIADAPAGVSLPGSTPQLVRELGHSVEHRMDIGDHVLSVDENRGLPGGAQGDVQDRTLLGDVDLFAAEHGIDLLAEAGFLGEL
jgi:hypothetical protein